MRTVPFGSTTEYVPNIIAGMMRIADKTDEEIRSLYDVARHAGINFFDHADLYGFNYPGSSGVHWCERRFSESLQIRSAERDEITIQTKAGIVPDPFRYDSSYEHIVSSAEGSLRALNTDYIDVLLIHRPDALVEPEEVARAFDELEQSGKVRAFGVSNHTPRQIDLLKGTVRQPIQVNQMQLSLTHSPTIAQGINANIVGEPDAVTLDGGGIVDYCRLNSITLQAWSPFQSGGGKRGVFLGSPDFPELNHELETLAEKYGVTPMAVATAWLTRHPANMQVVLGTTTPSRVTEASAGSDIRLTRVEWYGLFRVAGHRVP